MAAELPVAVGDQLIPRPADAVRGRPAPWEALPAEALEQLDLASVRRGLSMVGQRGPLAPALVRATLSTDPSAVGPVDAGVARRSAVLCALFEEEGQARVVLTRRAQHLRAHRGEVAFPGGRLEPGEDDWTAARREAFEEVGLDLQAPQLEGWLQPLVTASSTAYIIPLVASLPGRPQLVANPNEVERIFDLALVDLVAPGVHHEERWLIGDRPRMESDDGRFPLHFFNVAGETIWGATARLLTELCSLSLGLDPRRS